MIRRTSRLLLLLALPLAALVGACTEDIESGTTCPLLCPGQSIVFIDTLLQPAYEFDTVFTGFPLQGLGSTMLLANRIDTLDVRAVVRFDTLARTYLPAGGDTLEAVTFVDSAFLSLRLTVGRLPLPFRVSIEAYDVTDSTVADTATADLLPLFDFSRLLGSLSFDSLTFTDSSRIRIPLDTAMLREIITTPDRRLHIGLRLQSTRSAEMFVTPYFPGGEGPQLEYNVSTDTAVARVAGLSPSSLTPRSPGLVAGDFVDFSVIADAPDVLLPERFVVGGLPGARTYIRFDLPRWLTDSVGVLRARLELTQDPVRGAADTDTIYVLTHLVVAGHELTDLRRAATLLTAGGFYANTLALIPSDSGVRTIEMNALVRLWGTVNGERPLPSAIVLRTDTEGSSATAARFFSVLASDPTLRPRLRVTYTPSAAFGRP